MKKKIKNGKNYEKTELDAAEIKIVRELIRNPRASDNFISKKTKIPVMTVNRKRKQMEKNRFLRYYASLDKGEFGLHIFGAKQLYIIQFKIGITQEKYLEMMENDSKWRFFNSKFISQAYLGEKDGHLALALILDAVDESQLVEEFNGKIVSFLTEKLGKDAVEEIITSGLSRLLRVHHNYLPYNNIENGVIKDSWPDELIFVNDIKR